MTKLCKKCKVNPCEKREGLPLWCDPCLHTFFTAHGIEIPETLSVRTDDASGHIDGAPIPERKFEVTDGARGQRGIVSHISAIGAMRVENPIDYMIRVIENRRNIAMWIKDGVVCEVCRSAKKTGRFTCNGCVQTPEMRKIIEKEHQSKSHKKLRDYRKENGLCTKCGEKARENRSTCESCAKKQAIRDRNDRSNPKRSERRKKYLKRRRKEKAMGIPAQQFPPQFHWDHIIPCKYFNKLLEIGFYKTSKEAMSVADSDWNMRKIPASENIEKSDKMTDEAWALCKEHNIPIVEWKQ